MTAHFIAFPRVEGRASRQAHADLPDATFERELGKEGFFGPATMMYHRHAPTAWRGWEGPLRPRAFDLAKLADVAGTIWQGALILHHAAATLRLPRIAGAMDHLVRNADGDELLFVHRGRGRLFCDYGHIEIAPGDYVVLPRSTMWRLEAAGEMQLLLIEGTNGSYKV